MPMWEEPTERDLATVKGQLGRRPEGIIGVAARSRCGCPQVIATAPLRVNGQSVTRLPRHESPGKVSIFPTLYWLTCPMLSAAIGRLESVGWIARLKAELQSDLPGQEELRAAHARTAQIRRGLIPEATLNELQHAYPGQYRVLRESGVAGMRDNQGGDELGVKCLHAHFADYLAHGANPVGRRVWGLLTAAGVDPRGRGTCSLHGCSGKGDEQVRQAVIDVGSNSVRLLVAEKGDAHRWHRLATGLVTTRLGAGTAEQGQLSDLGMGRTVEALKQLRAQALEYGVGNPFGIATSAVREARNREAFLVRAWEEARVSVRVVSGEDEGQLSFRGALARLSIPATQPVILCDIGGGSTELIIGNGAGNFGGIISTAVGAVSLYTHGANGVASDLELQAVRDAAKRLIAEHPPGTPAVLVAVGGSVTTLAALDLRLAAYDPDAVTGHCVTRDVVDTWISKLSTMTVQERSSLPGMPPNRADILPFGLTILLTVMDALGQLTGNELVVSDDDLLQGVLLSVVD